MPKSRRVDETETEIAPYPHEALLFDALADVTGDRIVCTSPGLAQFAAAAARKLPQAKVLCLYLDLYRANLALEHNAGTPANLKIECAADMPPGDVDVVALPFSAAGEAELARDLLQTGHNRLRTGGRLFATTNNRKDTWLRQQMASLFRRLEIRPAKKGVLYVGTKTEPLKKLKNYGCEFAFRDQGRLILAFSRPGVFSHRELDTGARRLMNAMQLAPGMRVLDIGCGAGAVALAAACRDATIQVHAVDSSPRAIECVQRGAELNELTNITTELNATGNFTGAGTFDVALANPPYYAGFRIAEHFLTAAQQSLRPGGQVIVVTKLPEWYEENMIRWFDDATITELKGYHLITATRA